jgi:hypothetical protein
MRTTNRLTKVAAMAAALAAVSTVALVSSVASALPAGTAATSGQNLAQASGTGTSNFQLTLSSVLPSVASATSSAGTYTVTFSSPPKLVVGHKVTLAGFTAGEWNNSGGPLTVATVSGSSVTLTGFTAAPTASPTVIGTASANSFISCPGDGIAGYKWTSYMVPASVDVATLTYNASGPIAPSGVTFAQPLFSSSGSPQVSKSPGLGDGLVTPIPANLGFGAIASLVTNGEYKIGYACTLNGNTERYWQTSIVAKDADGTTFNWVKGTLPSAPVLTVGGVDNAKITGISFTAATGDPNVSGYTVTAVPQGGGTTVGPKAATAGAAFELTSADGVVNGKVYDVTVTATNANGSKVSNTVTTSVVAPPPATAPAVSTTGAAGKVTVNWTNSVPTGATLNGFVVSCNTAANFTGTTPAACASPNGDVSSTTLTKEFTLPVGTYYFRVLADYAAPFVDVTSASVAGSSQSAQLLIQNITVVRPAGALVLTQKCGVMGSAAPYNDPQMGNLPDIPATTGADPSGSPAVYAWDANGVTTLPSSGAPQTDPNRNAGKSADVYGPAYDGYPYPVVDITGLGAVATPAEGTPNAVYTANTNCDINLGIGKLITNGPNAGQYFATTGRINQLSVVNTQDIDGGWTLNGKMSNFTSTSDANDTFSGNLLGWNPEVTWDSLANLDGYDMEVLPGDIRQPVASSSGAGLGPNGATNDAAQADGTLGSRANSLAKSTIGKSLGMAVLDARLRLLIPVTADAGTYTGTLTFTTI